MTEKDLEKYMLEVDENYYMVWTKGKKYQINRHPVVRYEIRKGLDIPGIISWLRLSRFLNTKTGEVRAIMLSYYDGEHKRRTVAVPLDKERKIRVTAFGREVSYFTFRIVLKDQDI